ncbi:MAG: metallophosphoesterase [Myxococcota bacterium]|nr:metallophosphoesterase [Myxococcota bacterium]
MDWSHLGHAFVGDVQGCADEFEALVGNLEGELGRDFHLHCVGDMINRGPDNLRVLEQIRSRVESGRAEYVLGNHEIGLIARYLGLRDSSQGDTVADVLESQEAADWVQWLRDRSLCEAGELAGERYVMVHASVHPEWSFEDCSVRARRVEERLSAGDLESCRGFLAQTPEAGDARDDLGRLVSCRSVDENGNWSSAEPTASRSEPWYRAWGREEHDYGVVYGHWAQQGLVVEPFLRGLDTGCVHHAPNRVGSLTAWVPTTQPVSGLFALPDEGFVSESAHREHGRLRSASSRS